MTLRIVFAVLLPSLLSCSTAIAGDFSYDAIAERYSETRLAAKSVKEAKMHGECLVGLKELNFQKRDDFDPVAEWTNYRAISLLEQFPPCTVLIMIEVARKELIEQSSES